MIFVFVSYFFVNQTIDREKRRQYMCVHVSGRIEKEANEGKWGSEKDKFK